MSESSLLQSPRNRFMAFSAVGVAMVCLPLWQVLQYQQADMTQLAAERALLDPVSRAVQVQFGLLAHRQVAAQLLQGQQQLEPARLAVQVGVDDHLLSLSQDLTKGLWSSALAETRDLTRDWQALARQVKGRTLSAPQSEEAHALRIEQAVQVVDLVTLAEIVSSAGSGTARLAAAARVLTRMAGETPLPALPAQHTAELAAAQARLQARLTALERTFAAAAPANQTMEAAAVEPSHAAGSLRPALAMVASTTRQLLLLQPVNSAGAVADSPELQAQRESAWHSARTAQMSLFNQALGQHERALALREHTAHRQQIALLAAMALLSAAALALAAVLSRQLVGRSDPEGAPPHTEPGTHAAQGPAPGQGREADGQPRPPATETVWSGPVAGQAASPTRVEAVRLLDRLRTGTHAADAPRGASGQGGRGEPQDTLPPERS